MKDKYEKFLNSKCKITYWEDNLLELIENKMKKDKGIISKFRDNEAFYNMQKMSKNKVV